MLRCEDNSLYTGITTDIDRRLKEHLAKGNKTAKYTLNHWAIVVEIAWESENRSLASKLEYYIKRLTKRQKEEIVKSRDLGAFLSEKIEVDRYKVCERDIF